MKKIIKKILAVLGLQSYVAKKMDARRALKRYMSINRKNKNSILEYQKRFNSHTFIETGTYKGDMIEAVREYFDKIYSIEIGTELHQKAVDRFKKDARVEILLGDSATVLPKILAEIREPALFWLDAHDSGGDTAHGDVITPIEKELDVILNHSIKNHVILIDDARDFTGHGGYPTAEKIQKLAVKNNRLFEMKDDNFRIFPKQ